MGGLLHCNLLVYLLRFFRALYWVSIVDDNYGMQDKTARGCTGDFSKKKIFSNTFFSHGKLVDMVCRMKSHQGRFQKKSFSCVLCAFSRVFFLFCWEKCVFGWFSCCFHCCSATCVSKKRSRGCKNKGENKSNQLKITM